MVRDAEVTATGRRSRRGGFREGYGRGGSWHLATGNHAAPPDDGLFEKVDRGGSFRDSEGLRFGMGMRAGFLLMRNGGATTSCSSTPSPSCC